MTFSCLNYAEPLTEKHVAVCAMRERRLESCNMVWRALRLGCGLIFSNRCLDGEGERTLAALWAGGNAIANVMS